MKFEYIILSNLIYNEEYCRGILPFLKPEYFSNKAEKFIFENIHSFVNQYSIPPTKEAIAIRINNSNIQEGVYEETIEVLGSLAPDDNHMKWLRDETEQFCKKRALFEAMYKAIDIAEGNDKDVNPNVIPSMLMDALSVSFETNLGHDYWEDAEKHWQMMNTPENKFPFSIEVLNRATDGGVPTNIGSLLCMAGSINSGKSIFLAQQAADWLRAGKNVLLISMEMAESEYRKRIDVITMDSTFSGVKALEKTQYLNRVNSLKQKTSGKLIIKEYPAGSAHVGHYRHFLQELRVKQNFVPDLICVDYLTICASSKLPPSAKGNTNTYFGSVAEELRALAQELKIPIWTALQFDRATQGASDANMSNIGLAIAIAATADFMVASLTPEDMVARGQAIGKVIKNRFHSYKGKFIMGLNPEKQIFYDVDQASVMDEDELDALGLDKTIRGDSVDKKTVTDAIGGWSF